MKKVMKSKKMWLAVITIFISGLIIGLVSGLAINRHRSFSRFSSSGRFRNRIIGNLTRQLALNDEQQAKTEKIINAMSEQIRRYQTEQRPKIKAVIEKSMSEIEKLLTPEQLKKFFVMRAKIAKHHRGRRHGREHKRNNQIEQVPSAMPQTEHRDGEATEALLSPRQCLRR